MADADMRGKHDSTQDQLITGKDHLRLPVLHIHHILHIQSFSLLEVPPIVGLLLQPFENINVFILLLVLLIYLDSKPSSPTFSVFTLHPMPQFRLLQYQRMQLKAAHPTHGMHQCNRH